MVLRKATPDEIAARDAVTHAAWGSPLSIPEYQARERALRGHPWARQGMTTWVLTDGQRILSSCETFRMESRLDQQVGISHGVASVYTEPALRGKGYALKMMRELSEAVGPAHAIILFSDVGEALYSRADYAPRPSMDRVFEASEEAPSAVDAWIDDASLSDEWAAVRFPATRFLITPTAQQLDWHLERERFYAQSLPRPRPHACGARSGRSRAFWAGNLRKGELVVLWLDSNNAEEAVALLRAARHTAHRARLPKVTLWECPVGFSWPSGPDGGQLIPRDESLTMIRTLAPGLSPGDFQHGARGLWI